MLAVFFKQLTIQQLLGHLSNYSKNTQVRSTSHSGPCWRTRDKPLSDVLLWTFEHVYISVGLFARTFISSVRKCDRVWRTIWKIDDRDGWRKRVREMHAVRVNWWLWQMDWTVYMSYNNKIFFSVILGLCEYLYFRTHAHTHSYIYKYSERERERERERKREVAKEWVIARYVI